MSAGRQILKLNAFAPEKGGVLDAATAALVARRQATIGPTSVLFYDRPLHVVSAEGVWVQAADGSRYLDAYNNVPSVGHCNARVARAVAEQVATLNIHTRYLYDVVHSYAERLLATFPPGLDRIAFACTGSEANDIALRLATIATGRAGVVVTQAAYHGNTAAVSAVSPSSRPGKLAAHVRAIPAPIGDGDVGARFAADLRTAIASLEASHHGFAALLVDTIFSSDGVAAEPAGFLKEAVDIVHAAGGLFIADEVQPGFARTGDGFWGFARHGVRPDVVTMGKPMGNGLPIAAAVANVALMQGFAHEVGYFNTFGGNPVTSAAALAVLDEIEERGLAAQVSRVGRLLRDGLGEIAGRRATVAAVRGAGLYLGVEIAGRGQEPASEQVGRILNALRERHVLVGAAGLTGNTLKIRPPLVFEPRHAEMLLDALDGTLARL